MVSKGKLSLVLSVVSVLVLLLTFCLIYSPIGINKLFLFLTGFIISVLLDVIAIILGIISIAKEKKKKPAIVGLILGLIILVLVIYFVYLIFSGTHIQY